MKIRVAALQEVRRSGNGECDVDNRYLLLYSGEARINTHGTGLMIAKNLVGNVIRIDAVSK